MLLALETAVLCVLYWGMCWLATGTEEGKIKGWSSYPDEVQTYVEQHGLLARKPKPQAPVARFAANAVLFTVVLFPFGYLVRTPDVWKNVIQLLILGQVLNGFDLLVIDLLWWRNTPRVRFHGTEDQPELYRDWKKHRISFYKGIVLFFVVALVDGGLLSVIP